MKLFLTRICVFAVPLILLITIMEFLLRSIPNDYKIKKQYLDENADEIETLILGNSHTYYGLNPEYFEANSFNASYIAQDLKRDHFVFEKYIDSLTQLKQLIIPISYISLFGNLESSDESWRIKNYVMYWEMKNDNGLKYFSEILTMHFWLNLKRIGQYYFTDNANITSSTLGWGFNYSSKEKNDLDKMGPKTADRYTFKNLDKFDSNYKNLVDILKSCKKKGIEVLLFMPPCDISFVQNLNQVQLNKSIDTSIQLSNQFDNCKFLNLLENDMFERSDFYDPDHVNELGAEKLSVLISDYVNNL